MMKDMQVSSKAKGTGKYAKEEPETVSEAEEMDAEDEDEAELVEPDDDEPEIEEADQGLQSRYTQSMRDAGVGAHAGAAEYIRQTTNLAKNVDDLHASRSSNKLSMSHMSSHHTIRSNSKRLSAALDVENSINNTMVGLTPKVCSTYPWAYQVIAVHCGFMVQLAHTLAMRRRDGNRLRSSS
ncbi:hypothetical protein MRB53_039562 [Persea americana]|nr:hypothetical protein MRB53_039562 [Persea americana]